MFDRLFEFLHSIFHSLLPFTVLQPYEAGALVRLGKFKRVLEAGFHWVIPLSVDMVWQEHITPRTSKLLGMSTTTKDGRQIGFDAVITWKVSDVEKFVLGVTDGKDAIADTCEGIIGTELTSATWEQVLHGDTVDGLTAACRKRGWKWGIEIQAVQLAGIALVKNIRLSGLQQQGHWTMEHTA